MIVDYGLTILFLLYAITLLYLYRGFSRLPRQPRTKALPFVTVIVSAHNEEKNLPKCLEALLKQNYPEDRIEFIIVNDRSTDRTAQIITQFQNRDKRIRSITITDRLPDFAPKKRAIDTAIRQSQGEIMLLTDADGRPGPDWARTMVSYFVPEVDMVIGYAPYTIRPKYNIVKRMLALEYLSHAAVASASTGLGMPLTCVGTNMAYRKKMFLEIGGFGPFRAHISGDDDLFLTLVREAKRYKIAYANDHRAQVFNNPPRLWSRFLHQRMRYASKGFDYPLKVTAGLVLYYFFNFFLVVKSIFYLSHLTFSWPLGLLWLGKMTLEFIFMNKAGQTLGDRRALMVFPLAALAHPLYVVIFGAIGQIGYFRWAEEHVEAAVQKPAINKE